MWIWSVFCLCSESRLLVPDAPRRPWGQVCRLRFGSRAGSWVRVLPLTPAVCPGQVASSSCVWNGVNGAHFLGVMGVRREGAGQAVAHPPAAVPPTAPQYPPLLLLFFLAVVEAPTSLSIRAGGADCVRGPSDNQCQLRVPLIWLRQPNDSRFRARRGFLQGTSLLCSLQIGMLCRP